MDNPAGPVTSLAYVRMCTEVSGWLGSAADLDERERLITLVEYYRHMADESAARERRALLADVQSDLRYYLEHRDAPLLDRPYSDVELEQVRALSAVTPVSQVDALDTEQMRDLADLMESWAQTAALHSVRAARFFGLADGLRNLAEAVGPDWQPASANPSLSSTLVHSMHEPER
jgi:hypothetical protein